MVTIMTYPKNWIAENIVQNVALVAEHAHINFVEFRHHDEYVEDHGVVNGWLLLVLAVAILIEERAGLLLDNAVGAAAGDADVAGQTVEEIEDDGDLKDGVEQDVAAHHL